MFLRLGTMEILGDDVVSRIADHGVCAFGVVAVSLLREAKLTFFGIQRVEGAHFDVADVGSIVFEGGSNHFFDLSEDVIPGRFGDVDVVIFQIMEIGVSRFGIIIFILFCLAQLTTVKKRFPRGQWLGWVRIDNMIPCEVEEGENYDRQCDNRNFSSTEGDCVWNYHPWIDNVYVKLFRRDKRILVSVMNVSLSAPSTSIQRVGT
mmetsp:Transcript_17713/g.33740  ORF Transcript_17713/g.33740 Transcript_17713/m.33740 type:complete len:205 (-) Transcript_17713:4-618(-)